MATPMRIRVREPRTNNEVVLEVEQEHVISDIIESVLDHFQLQSGTYFLTREGTILNNGDRVDATSIEPGDTVIISPDPKGGARLPGPIWETRLLNEAKSITDNGFYQVDIQDDGPPWTERTFTVQLADCPAYQKVDENEKPVLINNHVFEVKLDRDFPDTAPQANFLTEIYHPNVYRGPQDICIGMLTKWVRTYSVIQLIQAVDQMLQHPNPLDPANGQACSVYEEHPLSTPFRPWHSAGGDSSGQPHESAPTSVTKLTSPSIVSRPQVITKSRIVSKPRIVIV
jgi:hypothetical protein